MGVGVGDAADSHLGVPEVALEHVAALVGGHVDGANGALIEGPAILFHDALHGEALALNDQGVARLDLSEDGLRDADRVQVEAVVDGYADQGLLPDEEHQVSAAIGGEVHPEDVVGGHVGIGQGSEENGSAALWVTHDGRDVDQADA